MIDFTNVSKSMFANVCKGESSMSDYLTQQFNVTRNGLLRDINNLDNSIMDVQPKGFNNTIHWHIGHILTTTEQFVFGFPKKTKHIPNHYYDLFANGTKPADWTGDVPDVDTLTDQLADQLERFKQIPAEQFEQNLEKPLLGQETVGGLVTFAIFHEANHVGQIHAMNLTAQASQ